MWYFAGVETRNLEGVEAFASDEQLFEQLHETTWPILFQIACNKLEDPDEAYDLLQELFIELWDKREVFPFQQLSLSWLKKRLWYKLISHFRYRGFKQRHLDDFQSLVESDARVIEPDEYLTPGFESQFALIIEAISLVVAQMPERMREVFLLSREQHFSIAEIAQRLSLSPHTVKNHLQAAMKRLRKSLEFQDLSILNGILVWWLFFLG